MATDAPIREALRAAAFGQCMSPVVCSLRRKDYRDCKACIKGAAVILRAFHRHMAADLREKGLEFYPQATCHDAIAAAVARAAEGEG